MNWLTFSVLALLTILLGLFVVRYWLQLLVIYGILVLITCLLLFPAIITFTWYFCKGITMGNLSFEGWERVYLYWVVFYIVGFGVYVGVGLDILGRVKKLIEKYL